MVFSHWLILVGNYSGAYRRTAKKLEIVHPNWTIFIAGQSPNTYYTYVFDKIGNLANEHHDKGNEKNTKQKIK